MKQLLFILWFSLILFGCNNHKIKENELNYISFNIQNDSVKVNMQKAIILIDKMDSGSGTSCFWIDGKLYYPSHHGKGFESIKLQDNKSTQLILDPLNHNETCKLFDLVEFFDSNGISSFGKNSEGIYNFGYKQRELNPYNDHKLSRNLVYLTEDTDTTKYFFQYQVVLDRFENILLMATKDYNEPKLPMDEESIMNRAE